MSQRSRSRMTGAAGSTPPDPDASPPAQPEALLAPESLARTLRAVADELDRDPELARRVASRLGVAPVPADPADSADSAATGVSAAAPDESAVPQPRRARASRSRLVPGTDPGLGTGIPDPFALHSRLGKDGLRSVLAELRTGTLRAIIREHRLDPQGTLQGVSEAGKLRTAILKAVTGKKK